MTQENTTPMMAQYLQIKAQAPGSLLFYRMGDFYEMFFDDAAAAAAALDITLTQRGFHLGKPIDMCGVPYHAAEGYLTTLIRKGFRVAIAEQMEDPSEAKKRGAKSVVHREIVRLVTPGTLTEDALLDARRNNYLLSYSELRDTSAIAWLDMSTGEFRSMTCSAVQFAPELARLAPSEIIISEDNARLYRDTLTESGCVTTPLSKTLFDSGSATQKLLDVFGVSEISAFGSFGRAEISALGAIVEYLRITQCGKIPHIQPPIHEEAAAVVLIDAVTRRSLELTNAAQGGRAGSLIHAIDRTLTSSGARLLERRMNSPSRSLEIIQKRQDDLKQYVEANERLKDIRDNLRRMPDLERAFSRLSIGRGGPRDLGAIRDGLSVALEILRMVQSQGLPVSDVQVGLSGLRDELNVALVVSLPALLRDGAFIAAGMNEELDELRQLREDGRGAIAQLEQKYSAETAIPNLRIKHNNVLGYFIETTTAHSGKLLAAPFSDRFIHRQTTANQVRFSTSELSQLETRILNAVARTLEIEAALFERLRARVVSSHSDILHLSLVVAEIDLLQGFADIAVSEQWTRPKLDETRAFLIEGGRHPVVEAALRRQAGAAFIANDCHLTDQKTPAIWLLTGPNMGGKSTFLRQNAIIALLAHIGSYVPARRAHIGVVSQIFSRVGASDDLARGRSTFMVEMIETAAILNQADDRALVILDEIGRGTATYDGLSIAWATLEHLHSVNKCRAIFATHYHEMSTLAGRLSGVENATVAVKEWKGELIFLHEIHKGTADRSYGVHVAQLAGLPKSVVQRAKHILAELEKSDSLAAERRGKSVDDLPLFLARVEQEQRSHIPSPTEEALRSINPDDLTPKEALQFLYDLKGRMQG